MDHSKLPLKNGIHLRRSFAHSAFIAAALSLTLVFTLILGENSAQAGKLNFSMGFFNLAATLVTGRKAPPVGNFGVYSLQYQTALSNHFEVGVGYTLLMSKGVGGDLGYGPDLNLYWYPFTRGSSDQVDQDGNQFSNTELWKPFLGVGFSQRQFQIGQASYAGFGALIGIERVISPTIGVVGTVSYHSYGGNSGSGVTEFDFMGGMNIVLDSIFR